MKRINWKLILTMERSTAPRDERTFASGSHRGYSQLLEDSLKGGATTKQI